MFKELANMIAGEMLFSMNFDTEYFTQQIQLMIIMVGSNPFFG